MTAIKEVEVARDKITGYIRQIGNLEAELEKAKQDSVKNRKSLTDYQKKLEALQAQMKDIVQENENFKEAVKHFKELGEKDKREMDKMAERIETLENNQKGSWVP